MKIKDVRIPESMVACNVGELQDFLMQFPRATKLNVSAAPDACSEEGYGHIWLGVKPDFDDTDDSEEVTEVSLSVDH